MNAESYSSFDDLLGRCDALEAYLPQLLVEYPEEGDFWSAFAGIADEVLEEASRHDSARAAATWYWLAVYTRLIAIAGATFARSTGDSALS